ncbi:MAG: acetylglutamate kinase [Candidatus Azobacteroides pseudotrichonymphae]|jgi:acetylglutamate kinase|nr:acetylglutamate kinase [Bacteroidales bacterium OttesenSCG-928-I14]GMO33803.1 MAG: acetylglutamate kinase [Candidatus Azobacteroides pseudotrichonymphae]
MERLTIVKVGGEIIRIPEVRDSFLKDFSIIAGYKILVHGGGSMLTELARNLDIETQMIDGRRVTTEKILKLAVMVYAGLINKEIVVGLQALGVDALGFTGADANIICSEKRPIRDSIDYGLVGDIQEINVQLLNEFLNKGHTPIFAPITHNGGGQLLNTNADSIAGELAKVLVYDYNVRLVYCFDKKGVLYDEGDENSFISVLSYADFQRYKENGIIGGGMLPKLDSAFNALSAGVKEVIITCASNIKHTGSGTHLKL